MIIALIGSARFEDWYRVWEEELAVAGNLALGLPASPARYVELGERERKAVSDVRTAQLQVCDAVLLLNVFAYIGEETLAQLEVARSARRTIYALESWGQGCGSVGWKNKPGYVVARRGYGISDTFSSPIDTMESRDPKLCMRYAFDLLGPGGARRQESVRKIHSLRVKQGLPESA